MVIPISGDSSTMDLPKGIVEDDKRIYELLANEAEIPVAALIRVWKLYTIMNRKLHDPTAHRLENFFWHIYGGDRRHLKPRTISALWEGIAMGPTVVPLRGPPNRYEPPPKVSNAPQPGRAGDGSRTTNESSAEKPRKKEPSAAEPSVNEPSASEPSSKLPDDEILPGDLPKAVPEPSVMVGTPTIRELSASSSRPPPPHPILKKSRGDSKTGPRPTARFASPPDSEEESRPSEDNSSTSTAAAASELRAVSSATSPGRSTKRRAGTPAKKFVASTSASKRRPVLPRRPSSQSSTGSTETIPRHGLSSTGSRHSGSQQGSLTSNPERLGTSSAVESVPEEAPVMSAKARGKLPATSKPHRDKRPRPQKVVEAPKSPVVSEKVDSMPPVLEQKPQRAHDAPPTTKSVVPAAEHVPRTTLAKTNGDEQGPARRTPAPTSAPGSATQIGTSLGNAVTSASSGTGRRASGPTSASYMGTSLNSVGTSASGGFKMERASSSTEYPRPRPTSISRISSYGLLSNATASTTNIEAMGQLSATDDPALQSLHRQAASASDLDNPYLTRNASTTSFAPTLASPTPPVPLARPRSQLTLLLEKENAKRRPAVKARSKS